MLTVLLSPELTPFSTAIALIVNLAIRQEIASTQQQQPQCFWWYYMLQGLLIVGLGAAYEMVVLSDYGNKGEGHGRSFMFWTGKALQEASFKKGVT